MINKEKIILMEHLRYVDIDFQDGRITSIFSETVESPYIINYIYNYNDLILVNDGFLDSDEEIELPTFVEQELLIPDDAVCGISYETPDCRTYCNHYFCREELTKWLEQQQNNNCKMTCPICRSEITQVFVVENN
jgi:hypothetical protein